MLEQLLNAQYGLEITGLSPVQTGVGGLTCLVETPVGKYVLKGVDGSDGYVVNEPEVAIFLKRNGLPITDYIPTRQGQYLWRHDGKVYHMQRFVEGEILPFHRAPDWFMAESAGLLGKIHAVLVGFRQLPVGIGGGFLEFMQSGNVRSSYERTLEQARAIHDAGTIEDVEYRLSQVDRLRTIRFDLAGFTCRNTHGDFKISQILCRDSHIEAIIDWTAACVHPVCWEIIRSFTYADPSCADGGMDVDRFMGYIRVYLRHHPLNRYDLQMMPYFFYHQLLCCDYYGQYYASSVANRGDFLFQAQYATKLLRWFEKNAGALSQRLCTLA